MEPVSSSKPWYLSTKSHHNLTFQFYWEFNDWKMHQVGPSKQTPLDTCNKLPSKTNSGDQMKQETGFVLSCLCGTRCLHVWMSFHHPQCILRLSQLQHKQPHAGAGDDTHHLLLNNRATVATWVCGALSGSGGSHLWLGGDAWFAAAAGMMGMMMLRLHS